MLPQAVRATTTTTTTAVTSHSHEYLHLDPLAADFGKTPQVVPLGHRLILAADPAGFRPAVIGIDGRLDHQQQQQQHQHQQWDSPPPSLLPGGSGVSAGFASAVSGPAAQPPILFDAAHFLPSPPPSAPPPLPATSGDSHPAALGQPRRVLSELPPLNNAGGTVTVRDDGPTLSVDSAHGRKRPRPDGVAGAGFDADGVVGPGGVPETVVDGRGAWLEGDSDGWFGRGKRFATAAAVLGGAGGPHGAYNGGAAADPNGASEAAWQSGGHAGQGHGHGHDRSDGEYGSNRNGGFPDAGRDRGPDDSGTLEAMTGVEGDDAVDESHDGGARGTSLDTQYTQPPADADAVGAAVAAALQGGLGDYAGALGRALLDDAMAGWRAEFLDAVTRAVISIKSVHGGTVAALLADCRVASAEAAAAAAAAAYSQSRHGATHEKGDGGQRDGEVQSGAGGDTDEGDADGPSSMTACMMELLRLVQAVEDDGELASVWMKGMGSCPAAWGLSLSVHFRVRHLITLRLAVLLLDVPPYMAARLLLLFS